MTFYVKPVSAYLTHDTQIFSNMDPYVVAILGMEKQRSKVVSEGGKRPKWTNDIFTFRSKARKMIITVYDKDTFNDDHVGTGEVDLNQFMNGFGEQECNLELMHKGRRAGTIKLLIRYVDQKPQQFAINNNMNYTSPPPYIPPQAYNSLPPQPYNPYKSPNMVDGWGRGNKGGWQAPTSPPAYNQNPYGQGPYGQAPYQAPYNPGVYNPPYGNNSWGNNPYGNVSPPQPNFGQNQPSNQGADLWTNVLQATLQNNPPSNNGWGNGWGNGW